MILDRASLTALLEALSLTFSIIPDAHSVRVTLKLSPRSRSKILSVFNAAGNSLPQPKTLSHATADPITAFQKAVAPSQPVNVEITLDQARQWKVTTSTDGNPAQIELRPLRLEQATESLPALTEEQLRKLTASWAEFSGAYEPADGARGKELSQLAEELGQPIPPELEAFLRLSNGPDFGDPDIADEMEYAWGLLDTRHIASQYERLSEVARNFDMNDLGLTNGAPGLTQLRRFHSGWIPFAFDGAHDYIGIDTVPAPHGTPGQIITFGEDELDGPKVIADSLTDLFADRLTPNVAPPTNRFTIKEADDFDVASIPTDVQELTISKQSAVSVRDLPQEHLKSLNCVKNTELNLAGIEDIPLLKLRIADISSVDLSPLKDHPTLRQLDLSDINGIDTAEVVATLPALEKVEIKDLEKSAEMKLLHALRRNENLGGVSYGFRPKLSLEELAERSEILTGSPEPGTTVETGVLT